MRERVCLHCSQNPEWDIAYLVLDTDLGSTRGWLGTGWDCGSARQTLNTIGYPGKHTYCTYTTVSRVKSAPHASHARRACAAMQRMHRAARASPHALTFCYVLLCLHVLRAGDKQNGGTNMYATSCVTRGDSNACQNRPLDHNCDTMGGQSGSPLYVTTSSNPQVRGVLTCSYTSPSIPWNCGAWLRPQVEEVLRDYLRRGS